MFASATFVNNQTCHKPLLISISRTVESPNTRAELIEPFNPSCSLTQANSNGPM